MKKITFLILFFTLASNLKAQTIAWSSDSEDFATGWGIIDNDGDGNNWGVYSGGGESLGFSPGAIFYSESWNNTTGALTPDNLLISPVFFIPAEAVTISYKMKVAALFTPDFAEKFAVYIYDNDDLAAGDTLIYEETLNSGGDGTAKDITASIPASFANKNAGIIIRHFDCTNQFQLAVDDFEVSYTTSLSVEDNILEIARIYPNPVKNIVNIDTNDIVDSATIINQLGQRVMDFKTNKIINNTIDLSMLDKGMYFMIIKSEERSATVKIIKD